MLSENNFKINLKCGRSTIFTERKIYAEFAVYCQVNVFKMIVEQPKKPYYIFKKYSFLK